MLQKLLHLITGLEKIEDGLFRGQCEDSVLRRIFGGQVVGQALYAAKETVPEERMVHSFHCYFLRPGNCQKPVIYDVKNLRNGNSFSSCQVTAVQNDRAIFYMTASFQSPETGFEHQKTMPSVPEPDNLLSEMQIAGTLSHQLPPWLKETARRRPLEIRPVEFHHPLKGHVAEPARQMWIRANGSVPDDFRIHQYLLGYASDLHFLPVSLQPHGIGFLEPGLQLATIDHSMWFHRPFNLNEWILYSTESTSASGGRGFVRGEFYTQDGVLVASTAQEGVIRHRR